MDKALVLKAEIRQGLGSKDAAKLRKKGQIPAVVYGHKKEPVSIVLDAKSFREGLQQGHRLMEVEIDKKNETLLIKEVQYDYLGTDIIHVDLMRVDVTEMVRVTVPIELKGTAKGAAEGGMVEASHRQSRSRVPCYPDTRADNWYPSRKWLWVTRFTPRIFSCPKG